ncbi:MAG: response regulator transcription factor [Mobilitalea sp.]
MQTKDILIVDDDSELAMITKDMLEDYKYSVDWVASAEKAYDIILNHSYQLIVLDINLPGESGFEFCRELRKTCTIPVVFVSARTSETDRITGLDLGADDYLTKPYSLGELLSRIKATLRRTYGFMEKGKIHEFGSIRVDSTSRQVTLAGKEIFLSLKEFDLLNYMMEHKDTVLKKEKILSEVWGAFSQVELSTIAVHIRWLREKLEIDPSKPVMLKTVWGIGYLFDSGQEI